MIDTQENKLNYVYLTTHLLCCIFRFVPKMDHILPSIREELLPKALEVPVNQCKYTCTSA